MTYEQPTRRRRRMEKFRLGEVSVVTEGMQEPARIAIVKRKQEPEALKNKAAVTTDAQGHSHTISFVRGSSEGMELVRAGQTSFVDGHVHDFIVDDAGNIALNTVNGHTHGIAALVKGGAEVDPTEILAEGVLDASGEIPSSSSETPEEGNHDMTKQTEETAEKTVDRAEHEAVAKRAERAEAILKLNPEQRAHFEGLDTEAQDSFLAKSDEERSSTVKAAQDSNAVVYTSEVDGTEYRKSDDQRLVEMAKREDKRERELAKERAIRKQAEFEKRAGDELPNLAGDNLVKGAILRAIEEGIEDEGVRKQALDAIKAKDAGLGVAFDELGTSAGSEEGGIVGEAAEKQLDELAKKHQSENPDLTPEQAYAKVIQTAKGRELQLAMREG